MALKQNCPAGGSITLAATDTANNYTVTLPASTGTLATTADIFPVGTVALFGQTAAPTGWTKITTYDNAALRVVSGSASSGGSVNFTTAFASQTPAGTIGATTLSTTQIPVHAHGLWSTDGASATADNLGRGGCKGVGGTGSTAAQSYYFTQPLTSNAYMQSTGSGGSHDHTFTGTAINLAVKYVDVIFASKN
jgi:hypothetical protein